MIGAPQRSSVPSLRSARGSDDAETEAARAAEALRRAGGAMPVERLHATALENDPTAVDAADRLARCLRQRSDLFLLIERPPGPWGEQDWTAVERAEYERRAVDRARQVVLVDGSTGGPGASVPALVRESLLTIWGERPEDDQIRRELARAVHSPATTTSTAVADR